MTFKSMYQSANSEYRLQTRLKPHQVVLAILWLVTTVTMTVMLAQGVRDTSRFSTARHLLQAAYVAALLWYLGRSGSSISQLAEIRVTAFARWRYVPWIPVLGVAIVFAYTVFSDEGSNLLRALMLLALGPIIVAMRRELSWRSVFQGVGVAVVALAAGQPMIDNGFVTAAAYPYTALAILLYVAGGLLSVRTRLGGAQLMAKKYLPSLRSFLWGCLLFVPNGLANAASGSPGGSSFAWVSQWWMPFSLPLWSGIVEEIWFRLFLVGLTYYVLHPAFRKHPAVAVSLAILFSGITFGLAHVRTLGNLLSTGLIFGVPFAAVYARRDWEHAVGAHYMVNMIPWLAVLLEVWRG